MNCFEKAPEKQKTMSLIAVYIMVLGSVLQSGTDNVVLPLAAAEIGGTEYYALAKVTSAVAAAIFMPMMAYLMAKDPSRKRGLFILSSISGTACILIRALAMSMVVIVAAGVLHGIFSAGVYVVGYSIIRDIYDKKRAATYLGFVGTINSVATLAGPILSGVLIDMFGWRFVCHIIWIIIALAGLFMVGGVKVTKEEAAPLASDSGKFDFIGSLFLAIFLGALTVFIALGTSLIPFGSMLSNLLLLVAIVGVICLIFVIRKKGDGCIVPLGVIKDRNTMILTIDSFLMNFSLMAVFFFIPTFILYVLNGNATQSSLATTLISVAGLFMSPIFARKIGSSGTAKNVITIGMTIRVVILILFMVLLTPDTKLITIYVLMFLAGFYQSQHTATMVAAPQIQIAADKRVQGNALIQVSMAIGSSIGTAVDSMVIAKQGVADGLKTAFIIAAVASVIVIIISRFLVKVETDG